MPEGGTFLEHVTITAVDFVAALDFYETVLASIGLIRLDELVDEEEDGAPVEAAAWGTPDGARLLWLVGGPVPTAGVHLRLAVSSRAEVEEFFAEAVRQGAQPRSGPRRWPLYRRGEFNAMVADSAGNVLEVVAPE